MHAVVEDGREELVKLHGKDELAVNVVQGPKDDADKHTDGEGGRGEDQVSRGAERLDEVGGHRDYEEDELEEHVEEGQVLPHAPELVSAPGNPLWHLNLVHLIVHRPGKAHHCSELHQDRHRCLDHLDFVGG